ncbi:endoglucanase 11-like [Hyalella azteca]|uniref:cellulase n=1 Tax=Hyalella azteca TaxID=294128 RepID=A0A8B7NSX0_HYAAZ|nr:endoglucanase 11-like [Hyalella azteca]
MSSDIGDGSSRSEAVGYCGSHGGSPYDYRELLCHALVFYEANRSGYLPSDQRVEWRGDSALNDGADNGVNLEGGYYDAGDLVKFGFPLAFSVTFLSWGYIAYGEAYVQAGQTQYLEKTIKWATDFILKAHTTPTTIWAQVGDALLDHSLWGPPEDMTMARPSYKLDQDAPGKLEIFILALLAELLGGNYLNILQSNIAELRNLQTTPGGMHYFQHWGSLRYALNHGFIAFRAADLGLDTAANNEFGERQINYALGSNPRSSSYVVGVGNNPPTHCHHRAASCPGPGIPCGWDYGNSANPNPHILYGAIAESE